MATDTELPSSTPEQDAWLESLLHDDAMDARYLDDNGFTARLMAVLPPARAAQSHEWILALMAALGILIGGVWLSGIDAFAHALLGLADWRTLSVNNIVMIVLPVAMFYWFVIREALE